MDRAPCQPATSTVSGLTAGRDIVRQIMTMIIIADRPTTAPAYASADQPHYLLFSILSAVVIR